MTFSEERARKNSKLSYWYQKNAQSMLYTMIQSLLQLLVPFESYNRKCMGTRNTRLQHFYVPHVNGGMYISSYL